MTQLYRGGAAKVWLADRCRQLRDRETPAEHALWELLRGHRFEGLKFRRQHQFGAFILDFYCPQLGLAVEVDGDIHESREAREADAVRTRVLAEAGVRIVRFENSEVVLQPSRVLECLRAEVSTLRQARQVSPASGHPGPICAG